MKVGFYLQNRGISDVDCSDPMAGNPGIGGTEYMFIGIPFGLWCDSRNGHDVWLLANSIQNLPHEKNCAEVESDSKLAETVERLGIETVVLRPTKDVMSIVGTLPPGVKVILWAHNFLERYQLSVFAEDSRIACILCVGNEQLQMYRDHQAFYKSAVIYNGFPVNRFIENESRYLIPFPDRKNEVTYLGALVKFKGFHVLAKAWKRIVEEVPDAHLNVIGGAGLYDRAMKPGRWGIAEESYEDMFMPYLIGDDGGILPSVTFYGTLGHEKKEILRRTKVGVPSACGETFCISALEFQLNGAVVSAFNLGGVRETVYKTGILYGSPDDLAESVIRQLKYRNDNDYDGYLDFVKRFDFSSVTVDWIKLFDTLRDTGGVKDMARPKAAKGHRLEECNRLMKKVLPFGRRLPTLMYYRALRITLEDRLSALTGKKQKKQ